MQHDEELIKIKNSLSGDWIKKTLEQKFSLNKNHDVKVEYNDKNCDDSYISISCKLLNDSDRLFKRSKTIKIIISEEFLEDQKVSNGYDCKSWFKNRLNTFTPEHDAGTYEIRPVEKFILAKTISFL